jgi:hypothetical protein
MSGLLSMRLARDITFCKADLLLVEVVLYVVMTTSGL